MASSGEKQGQFSCPEHVAFDHGGNAVICNKLNNRMEIISASDGALITTFGSQGRTDGLFHHLLSVCVDGEGRIFVGDGIGRVQVFV